MGPEPPFGLCLAQASLLYGALPASVPISLAQDELLICSRSRMNIGCFCVVFQVGINYAIRRKIDKLTTL